jgi:epoxyqueuosine reductase
VVRVARPDSIPDAPARLRGWLEAGYEGDMAWMNERADQRADPATLWPEVRSVIMLGLSYAPDIDPLAALEMRSTGAISVYARRRDYHEVLKGKLKTVGAILKSKGGSAYKVFVDTAPVMEKRLAEAAGLGWQGKHSVLVSRTHGSWLFLGAIYTSADLPADEAETDHCGSCTRCLDICPTAAFPEPYVLDARRCIAYLTIEHEGHIDAEFRTGIGNRIFGCDDCLAVCPWNKFAERAQETRMALRAELGEMPLSALAGLDDASFRALFSATPVKRTGRDRFVRNVMIAIGNSGDLALVPVAELRLDDQSPLVRAMAVWALTRLDPARARTLRLAHVSHETDSCVLAEWKLAA